MPENSPDSADQGALITPYATCKYCNETKPADERHFHRERGRLRKTRCIACHNKFFRARRAARAATKKTGAPMKACHGCHQVLPAGRFVAGRCDACSLRTCSRCHQSKLPELFKDGDVCATCALVGAYSSEREQRENEQPKQLDLFAIPLTYYETNKPEKGHRILCERCNKRHDPRHVAFFGAICGHCWTPDETPMMQRQSARWARFEAVS